MFRRRSRATDEDRGGADDLKRRVEELEASLETLETSVQASLDAMPSQLVILDSNGKLVRCNQAWREAAIDAGFAPDELCPGFDCFEVCSKILGVDPETADRFRTAVQDVFTGARESFTHEYKCRSDGSERWFEARARRFSQGDELRVACVHTDISDRVGAREQLEASEERYRSIFESIPIGMHVYRLEEDGDLVLTGANPASDRILDQQSRSLVGRTLEAAYPDLRETEIPVRYREVAQGGGPWQDEHVVHEAESIKRAFAVDAFRIGSGQMVAAFQDIAARKRAEETLRRSEERLRAVFDCAPDSVFIKNASLRYTHVNPAMARLTGMTPEELIGSTDAEIFGEEAGSHIREVDGRVLGGETIIEEHSRPVAGVDRTFHVVKTPMRDEHGAVIGVCGIARDITEQKRDQELLLKVAEGVSSAVGEEFFESLVRYVAAALDARFAVVGRLDDESGRVARTIAACGDSEPLPNFEYTLAGTPCEGVVERGICVHDEGVAEEFPDDEMLAEWGIESYVGTPLADSSGRVLGLLVIMDDKPLGERRGRAMALLQIFAARAADELERRRAEAALVESERRYELATRAGRVGVWDWDLESGEIYIDPLIKAMLGYGDDEVSNRIEEWERHVHSDDRDMVLQAAQDHLEGSSAQYEVAHRMLRKDGEARWFLARGSAVRASDGTPIRVVGTYTDVTDRKRSEATILSQNQFLNTVIAALSHPFYVIDAKTYEVRLSNSAGRDAGAEGAMTCYAMSHGRNEPCNGTDHPCPLEMVRNSRKPVTVEHVHVDRFGRSRRYEIHGYPVFGEAGEVEQMIEYAIDVTDRRVAEDQIRRRDREIMLLNWVTAAATSDMESTAVLEAACRELAGTFDLPRVIVALMESGEDEAVVVAEHRDRGVGSMLGEPIQMRGKPSYQYFIDGKLPIVANTAPKDPRLETVRELLGRFQIQSLLAAPVAVDGEIVGILALTATQKRAFSSEEVNLAMSVAGQIAGSLARARLSAERTRLQTAIEQSVDSVLITDTEGRIVYVNPAFEEISGYSREEVLGQNPRLLKSGRHDEVFYDDLWRTISSGEVWRGRLVNYRKDGEPFTEDAVISPIRDDAGEIVSYVAVKRDVTREVLLEEQYLQAQKMEGIGRLAGGVAHDFNNLLGAVIGFAELALSQIDEDHDLREPLEEILAASENGANLTRQLLTFARRQASVRRPTSLTAVVVGMERMVRRLIGENINFITRLDPQLWSASVDSSQMEQVLMNLVINARDAMPDGGALVIETCNLVLADEDDLGKAMGLDPGEYVRLTVSDSGIGMTDEIRANMFEPFFTTKERGKGTGLGLATCFGIVTQSGGRIVIDSELGAGTSVAVFLPKVDEAHDPSGENVALEEVEGGNETILLVEDDFALRRLMMNILEDLGYTVLDAADGVDAQLRIISSGKHFHVLVTDVVMPRLGGWELATSLREIRPNLPVVFITGYQEDELPANSDLPPNTLLLQKPFSPFLLARLVRDVIDISRPS